MSDDVAPSGDAKSSAVLAGWSEALSVGSTVLDEDHRAFFDLATMLHNLDGAQDIDLIIQSSLSVLDEYILGHFLREEKAMRKVNYPRMAEHVLRHRRFQARVRAIAHEYSQGSKAVVEGLPDLVAEWLREHILRDDMQYKNWINDRVVDDRPLVFLAMEAEG